jgi:alpha-tubulin suppressor-like RCC1 family protein
VYEWTLPASGGWANHTQTAELTGSDGAASDELGYSVGVSGSTIVAGAAEHKVGTNAFQGAVYEWTLPASGVWKNSKQTAELTASDGLAGGFLGISVAVSGSTIVAGALGPDGDSGAVYAWTLPASGVWKNSKQTAELTASDGAASDFLGFSVAVSGSMIVAGAESHGGQGASYAWRMPASGGWVNATQTAELGASDSAAGDELGYSVGVSGSTIVAGAPAHKVGSHSSQGVVHEYDSTGWKAPKISSAARTTFTVGQAGSFTVDASGVPVGPTLTISDGGAQLPGGVRFVDNGNGTATLSGTPAAGSESIYPIAVTASNGVFPGATQSFTLTVGGGPPSPVSAWGDNGVGELGIGTHTGPESCNGVPCSNIPIPVTGLTGVTAVSAGRAHGLALLSNGTVRAWGENQWGQLGNGTQTASPRPVTVSGLTGVTAIAAGGFHSLALLKNGTVMAWGEDDTGQAAGGTFTGPGGIFTGPDGCSIDEDPCTLTPTTVTGLTGVRAIAAGDTSSYALLANGTVVAWGESSWGDLGDGTSTGPDNCSSPEAIPDPCNPTPVAVKGLSGVKAISAGADFTLALLNSGNVMAWGYNGAGQLGDGTDNGPDVCLVTTGEKYGVPVDCSTKPVAVSGLGIVAAVSAGTDTSYGLGVTGAVAAWGGNEYGQLGIGTATGPDTCGAKPGLPCSLKPVLVSGIKDATAITAGKFFGLALRSNGTVMGWGVNDGGALGDGSTSPATGCGCVDTPVAVKGLSGVTALSPEGDTDFSLALRGAFPTLSGFSPTSGVAAKTLVTITGTNLAGASAVKFNGMEAAISSDTATQIKATVPNGATTGKITVTTPNGTATSASSFTVTFTLSSFTPASGPAGTDVTITGTGFTSSSTVKFNGVAATVLSRTPPGKLVAVATATATTGPITVTNTAAPAGTVTSATNYTKT